jgi:hypothetical protein
MGEWNRGSQPYCGVHGFEYHSCCKYCRHEHDRETEAPRPCEACKAEAAREEERHVK